MDSMNRTDAEESDVTLNGEPLLASEVALLDAALDVIGPEDLPESIQDPVSERDVDREDALSGARMVRVFLRSASEDVDRRDVPD